MAFYYDMCGAHLISRKFGLRTFLAGLTAVIGPGLVVMFADTDAGSVVTIAQSGAKWGYSLLLLQVLIIPLMLITQELAVRLALGTGQGQGELILKRMRAPGAFLILCTLGISCFGALITELSGIAAVGSLVGLNEALTVSLTCAMIFSVILTGSYVSIERIAIALGSLELAFLAVAWKSHPNLSQLYHGLRSFPLSKVDFRTLVAANIGTSIMPWAVFYQQSALVDKKVGISALAATRIDTILGAALCQILSIAILMSSAAAFFGHSSGVKLQDVHELIYGLVRIFGLSFSEYAFALALIGGALVAIIVVTLAAAWAFGEFTGLRHSLVDRPLQAPAFYCLMGAMLILSGLVVSRGVSFIHVAIFVGTVNAVLLPIVLGTLYWLALRELPAGMRLRGVYSYMVGIVFLITGAFSFYTGISGWLWPFKFP